MAIAGLLISLLALGFSLFTYIKHDSKIKKQSALINEYEIEKIKDEKIKSKKAIIEGNVVKDNKGNRNLKIYNRGKSVAKDVTVKIPDVKGIMKGSNPTPIEIRPQQGIEIDFFVTMGAPDLLTVEYYWKDDFSSDNSDTQTFQL
ncbi:hypothetical protein [Salegentibacter salarius]|uniref:Uncharacterized protein n=1 Tax=Salegentibacter salarius TaxID=435906 RepID=A0A2N0TPD3_9FLAO|nr:hypothetical protein [Salegentibacter salarius]OEY71714.1 hypothetical protein BHS39_15110 [Salegentibacter salarius]PKD16600.1 hypothetical protein APR40_15080 [Salegentibacter salarius]SLK06434.1 hypothetical protein SAMN05660445_03103 [Salegentibacter salarius]